MSCPRNSTAKRYINGRDVHSDPRQTAPNIAVGTEPSSSTSLALPLTSPNTVPTAMPSRTTTPTTSIRRLPTIPRTTPTVGKTPLRTSDVTVVHPWLRSHQYNARGPAMSNTTILATAGSRPRLPPPWRLALTNRSLSR